MKQIQRVGAYALITAENHLLLTLLTRGVNRGRWHLPGGGIEWGESPVEALRREVFEEIGWQLGDVTEAGHLSVTHTDGDEQFHFMGMLYRAPVAQRFDVSQAGDTESCGGARWFRFDELASLTVNAITAQAIAKL